MSWNENCVGVSENENYGDAIKCIEVEVNKLPSSRHLLNAPNAVSQNTLQEKETHCNSSLSPQWTKSGSHGVKGKFKDFSTASRPDFLKVKDQIKVNCCCSSDT